MDSRSSLLRATEANYGSEYRKHFFEQYKLYIEMADRISQRRTSASSYLVTVNSFLVALYGVAAAAVPASGVSAWRLYVPIAGILVCALWTVIVHSYRQLNTIKWGVVREFEAHLPAAPYDHEWALAGEGKGATYWPVSHLERAIPLIFATLYLAVFIHALT